MEYTKELQWLSGKHVEVEAIAKDMHNWKIMIQKINKMLILDYISKVNPIESRPKLNI